MRTSRLDRRVPTELALSGRSSVLGRSPAERSTRAVIVIAVSLFASACAPQERAATSGAYQRQVDAIFLRQLDARHAPRDTPIAWAPGQWVLTRSIGEDGERSIRYVRLLSREDDGFWIETETIDPATRTVSAARVEGVDPTDPRPGRIVELRVRKNDGDVETYDPSDPLVAKASADVHEVLALLTDRGEPGAPVSLMTPAGTFERAFRTPVSIPLEVGTATGDVWYTNAVPVIFWARREMAERVFLGTREVVEEVVDFGLAGAESALPLAR